MRNYLGLFILLLLLGCKSNTKQNDKSTVESNKIEDAYEDSDDFDLSQFRDVTGLVDAKAFHRLIQEDSSAFIIDARPSDVWETEPHIKGAHDIKGSGHLAYLIKGLDKKHRMMVYCGEEIHSPYVVKFLVKSGFVNVYELKGGLSAWKEKGFKLVAKKKKLKRQFLG
jgi:rhodanese-related sulfurtransferase